MGWRVMEEFYLWMERHCMGVTDTIVHVVIAPVTARSVFAVHERGFARRQYRSGLRVRQWFVFHQTQTAIILRLCEHL